MSARSTRIWPPFLTVILLAGPAAAAEEPIAKVGAIEGITEYKLPNGFRVLLVPDDSKPIVTVNNTVFVGSRHEGYGETGMAHLLEHMCVKSTPTHSNIFKSIREHGGSEFNAYTRMDVTNFFEVMPASDANLEFGIKLEADRLLNCDIKREDLITEMTVVRNEFEMNENSPYAILGQRMIAAAFEWHNYGKSVLGNRSDIERYPIENLQAFYKKHYRVDNAMLVVAGKFDEKKALEWVVQYFGTLKKPSTPLPATYTQEPAQDGEREVVLRRVGTVGAVAVLYHVPAAAHEDYAALAVLTRCLAMQPEGRLRQALVHTKKAASSSGTIVPLHDPGYVIFEAEVENPATMPNVRTVLLDVLENLSTKPITEDEVARVKKESKLNFEDTLRTTKSLALDLTSWAGLADWRLLFIHRDRVQQVTAVDVNRVAAKYLKRENRTIGVYHPSTTAVRVEIPEKPIVAKLIDGYKGRDAIAGGEAFEATPENIEKRVTRGMLGGIKTAYLPRKTRGDTVEFNLTLHFGNASSLQGKDTAIEWLGSMLTYGTKHHNRQQLQDAWNKLEANVSISSSAGNLSITGSAKKEHLAATLKLLVEMLRAPAFPEADFNELKRKHIADLTGVKTEPSVLASIELQRKLYPYPKRHLRYRLDLDEGLADAEATTLQDVVHLFDNQLSAAAGELVVIGAFEPAMIEAELGKDLRDWTSNISYERVPDVGTPVAQGERIVIRTPDKANATYVAGVVYPMTDRDPDYAALLIANHLLGGRADNRLFNRVRVEKGLSYSVSSSFAAHPIDKSSILAIEAIANPENMGKVNALIAEELGKFVQHGVTADEVAAAQKELIEKINLRLAESGTLIAVLREGLQVGRTASYVADVQKRIQAVTPEMVKTAVNKVLDPKKLIVVEAGDFKTK
jgi:zinc protease